ncbi:MAG: hypothetical protein SGJ19_23065 [Planctomycetia bacterium]|nr:hypothetical protein [Planctomycetia bacterium]
MDERIDVYIASDDAHEYCFALIEVDGKHLASLSQEEGVDKLVIELPGLGLVEDLVIRSVPLEIFQRGVERAVAALKNRRPWV